MTDPIALYTDATRLTREAYATPDKLNDRISIYAYQEPRHDLRVHVKAALDGITGTILDLGCGPGGYARALRSSGLAVVACDLSAGMASAAGAPAVVADAMALPYADAAFGGALAMHMLYHVPDPAAAIAEIRRVTRPGATVVISTNAREDKAELRALHAAGAADAGYTVTPDGPAARFNLDDAEILAGTVFPSVQRLDLTSLVTVPIADPVVAFIDSTRSWYGDGPDAMIHVRRRCEELIARDGAFRFRTHSGILVCR